ncbi:MAG: hypothetical protein ABSE82_15735, partial [Nitrososphaerales archaeon]
MNTKTRSETWEDSASTLIAACGRSGCTNGTRHGPACVLTALGTVNSVPPPKQDRTAVPSRRNTPFRLFGVKASERSQQNQLAIKRIKELQAKAAQVAQVAKQTPKQDHRLDYSEFIRIAESDLYDGQPGVKATLREIAQLQVTKVYATLPKESPF